MASPEPQSTNVFITILIQGPPLIVAVLLHELAHGYAALWLGDPTAKRMGRLTLNPIAHIDPIFTIALPLLLLFSGSPVLFGGAKPVPIDPQNFQNPRRAIVWVALAGPVTNFILATLCYLGLIFIGAAIGPLPHSVLGSLILVIIIQWLQIGIIVNLVLGVFNLFPIPPLDGGRIAVGILPLSLARPLARLERWGLLVVFLLLYMGVLNKILNRIILEILRFAAA
jgi:Zn-dependent protease